MQTFQEKSSKLKQNDQLMNSESNHNDHSFSFNQGHNMPNPEDDPQLVKGMLQVKQKNKIIDLWSKKKSWEDIDIPVSIIHKLQDLRMDKPSIIQANAIPEILKKPNQNFVFQAINGSGKTLAFGIPALLKVNPAVKQVQVIIIANTRELIRQIKQVITKIGENISVSICIGDTDTPDSAAQVVVTVPRWIENKVNKRRPIDLSHLKLIVFDEADEIFIQQPNHSSIKKLIDHIEKIGRKLPQIALFSATFDEGVMDQINHYFGNIQPYRIQKEALQLRGVKMFRLNIDQNKKDDLVKEFYLKFQLSQNMIFVNKKKDAIALQDFLKNKMNIAADKLIGGIEQKERDKIIDGFRLQETNSLICTNVLARGIDVPEVDLVINYDVPFLSNYGFKQPDFANYLHRVGRTGRFGTDGIALTLVSEETDSDMLDEIEKFFDIKIPAVESLEDLEQVFNQMRNY